MDWSGKEAMKGLGKQLRILAVCVLTLCLLTVTVFAASAENCPGNCTHQAAVGTVHYDTLEEAVSEVASGSTVTLLTDLSVSTPIVINQPLILDLGGKTLSASDQAAVQFAAVGILRNGKISAQNASAVLVENCTVQIEKDAALESTGDAPALQITASEQKQALVKLFGSVAAKGAAPAIHVFSEKGTCELYILKDANITSEDTGIVFDAAGNLMVEDGTITAKKDAVSVILKADRATELCVTGGKLLSEEGQSIAVQKEESVEIPRDFVTGGTFTSIPSDYMPSHSQTQENTDGSYTVVSFYTLSFLPGSGSGTMDSVQVPCGSSVTLPGCGFSAAGMDFAGWDIGGTLYTPGSSYTPTGNISVTALWKAHVHTGGSATCLRKAVCSSCGASYGELTGHSMVQTEELAPTCTETGMKAHSQCRFCGDAFADGEAVSSASMIIPALGHDWEEVEEVPATCQKDGTKAYRKCKVCQVLQLDGKDCIEEDLVVPKTGHQLEDADAVAATCTNEGVLAHQYCIHCNGLFLKNEPVKAADLTTTTTSHVLSDWQADETCHWKNCVDCSEVFLQKGHHDTDFNDICDDCGYALTAPEETEQATSFSPSFLAPVMAAVIIGIIGIFVKLKKKAK